MKTVYSVAEARENFAEILNLVAYSGSTVTVEKYGKPVMKMVPIERARPSVDVVKKYAGIWKGKKWAAKVGKPSRYFRKRDYWS